MAEMNIDPLSVKDDYDYKMTMYGSTAGSQMNLSECSDEQTIQKIKAIKIPNFTNFPSSTSLVDRVQMGSVNEAPKSIVEQLKEIEPKHFRAVQQAIQENPEPERNVMIKVEALVVKILEQLNRIAENDREKIEKLKNKYRTTTLEAAQLQRDLGNSGFKFAALAFGASFLRLTHHPDDKAIADIFAGQLCPELGKMFGTSIQADMNQANSLSSLLIQEYQAKANKGSSDSTSKQEITALLEKALRLLEAAARNG